MIQTIDLVTRTTIINQIFFRFLKGHLRTAIPRLEGFPNIGMTKRYQNLSRSFLFAIPVWWFCLFCPLIVSAQNYNPGSGAFQQEEVVLQLRWFHQFQFAGYYAAKEKGFYRDEGLDVTILQGGLGVNTVEEVVEGRAHYGVTNSEILLHRLNNKPLVLIAAVFQHSPLVLLTKKESGIDNPQELIHHKIKMTRDSRDIELHAMFRNEGVSLDQLDIVDAEISYTDYFDKGLDAISAYLTNEPFYLEEKNIPYTVINPASYGIDFYGDCLFTSEKESKEKTERVFAFKRASLKGWQYAMKHQEEIIELIHKRYNKDKSLEHLRFEANAITKLIVPDLIEIGHINKGRWQNIARTFAQFDMVPRDYSLDGFLFEAKINEEPVWLNKVFLVMLLIVFVVGIIAVSLYRFNQKLQKEVKERIQSEEALKDSEARFRVLIDNAEILVSIYDRNGICLLMNNKAAEYQGGKPKDFINSTIYDFHPQDEAEIYLERIRQVIDSGESRIFEDIAHYQSGARWLINSIQPLKNSEGDTYAVQIISNDITDRKKAEEDLKESEERYRAVSEITSDFAYAFDFKSDDDIVFRWATDAILEITGYTLEEIRELDMGWDTIIHSEDRSTAKSHRHELKKGNSSVVEYRIIKKDGTNSWLRDHAESKKHGVDFRIYGAIEDITESVQAKEALEKANIDLESRVDQRTRELNEINKKLLQEIRVREEAEEKLIYAKRQSEQANSAKTEFLANVSHELRTPMHHILNYSRFGMTKYETETRQKLAHYFTQIRKTGDRLMLLLNDLLDLSKLETGKVDYTIESIDLFQLIKERIAELNTMLDKKQLNVNVTTPTVETELECDAYKIGQVIQNLMSNAIKFSSHDSQISIYFEPSVLAVPLHGQGKPNVVSAVSVFIGDQGVGIPELELEAVFDKFVQSSKTRTGAGGTGLGLSISKEIIEAHHGVIYAENNIEGGATFVFTLPYLQDFEDSEEEKIASIQMPNS